MKTTKFKIILLLLLCSSSLVFSQVMVQGTVSDSSGNLLPGVSIVEKGTTNGTVSDFDGNFELSVQDDAIIIFSYVGFLTQAVGASSTLDIILEEDIANLEEVIVTGYGGVRKKDLVSSISQIKGDAIENKPVSRVDNLLQGQAAGVEVTQVSGEPGVGAAIRIRGVSSINGNNSPLYVIDGFIAGTGYNLSNLNVNDIESIQVLKDASSLALYGTRGASGVILINTKSGKASKEGTVNVAVNHYTTFASVTRMPQTADLKTYAEFWNEAVTFVPGADGYGDNDTSLAVPYPDYQTMIPTDWKGLVLRDGLVSNTDVTVSGNSEKSNYYVSFNKYVEDGVIKASGINRNNLRINFDTNLNNNFRTGVRLNLTNRKVESNKVNLDQLYMRILPTRKVYNDDGTYTGINPYSSSNEQNPVARIEHAIDHNRITNLVTNAYVEYDPIPGLTFRSTLGVNMNFVKQNDYLGNIIPARRISGNGGLAIIGNELYKSVLNENTLTYETEYGDSRLTVLAGFTLQKNKIESNGARAEGFPNDVVTFNNLSLGSDPSKHQVRSGFNQRTFTSILARINYSYKDKYLLTLVGREDGSSVFETGRKFAFFPSAGAAWRIDQEDFMSNQNTISNFKLRASYGVVGEQGVPTYNSLEKFSTYTVFFNNQIQNAVLINSLPSKNLTWEKTYQTDIGFEMGFLDNKVNLEFDYYNKQTKDLLLAKPLPGTAGGTRLENVGEIENVGFEASVSSVNIQKNDFNWSSTFTISSNKNKVLSLGAEEYIDLRSPNHGAGGSAFRLVPGQPGPVMMGLNYLGTYKTRAEIDADGVKGSSFLGSPRYEDVDKNGVINDLDMVVLGSAQPDFYGGLRNTLTYKNFTLDFFIHGSYGNEIFDASMQTGIFGRGGDVMVLPAVKDRWTPNNPTSDIPRAGVNAGSFQLNNSYNIIDGSFLRLKNVTLSYDFDPNPKLFDSARLYVSGNNLALLTKFGWGDPEQSNYGANSLELGAAEDAYPYTTSITVGLKLNL